MDRKNLLIVDNDARYRRSLKRIFRRTGYELFEAGSVAEASSQLQQNPDLRVILLDLSLKEGSGLDLLPLIELHRNKYLVIILTAHEDQLDPETARKLAFRYLPKSRGTAAIRFAVSDAFDYIDHGPLPIKVFISYTNPDFDKVTWIYRRLKDNGFLPWIDKVDLRPGFSWDTAIETAISECDCVLSCLSDIAIKRLGYFQKETRLAVARYDIVGEPFILPLRFDNCELPKEFVKRKIQHFTYDPVHDDWWDMLVVTLRSIDIRSGT